MAQRGGAELVLLDNFSTLCEVMDENDAAAMTPTLGFLLRFKQARIACVLVHHSNKGGETFRGSSKLATTFEVIIGLMKPEGAPERASRQRRQNRKAGAIKKAGCRTPLFDSPMFSWITMAGPLPAKFQTFGRLGKIGSVLDQSRISTVLALACYPLRPARSGFGHASDTA